MNDIFESPAFQEFLQKRVEEIIENDEEYQKINDLILQAETEIKPLVSGNILKKINEYEKLNLYLVAHAMTLVYVQGLKDFKIGG